MKIFKGRSKRSLMLALLTASLIIVLTGLNLLLTILGRTHSIYVDMTPEEFYTVSDEMIEECGFINNLGDKNVKITFCNDPDRLTSNTVTRVTYFMALKMAKLFDNFEVETVNVNFNPTAVAKYKATSLSVIKTSDVIISFGDRYRIMSADNFWTVSSNNEYWSYNGEYKLVTAIKSVTLANDKNPTAYFVTGHGETVYDPANPNSEASLSLLTLKNLLLERGLKSEVLDISTVDAIPEDCAMLIINNPTSDFVIDSDRLDEFFYVSDIEKIDRYMTKKQGALMIAKDPSVKLPILEGYLSEWGFLFSESIIKDEESFAGVDTIIGGVYDTDETGFGTAIYGDFANLDSAPMTVFMNTGYISNAFGESDAMGEPGCMDVSRTYIPFLTTPTSAIPYAYDSLTGGYTSPAGEKGSYALCAVAVRNEFDDIMAEHYYSYAFCANSADFFTEKLLGNAAYANYDVMSSLVNNISRTDIYASSSLGGTSLNSEKYGGKRIVSTTLNTDDEIVYALDGSGVERVNRAVTTTAKTLISITVAVLPVAMLVMGVVTYVKRKFK